MRRDRWFRPFQVGWGNQKENRFKTRYVQVRYILFFPQQLKALGSQPR